MTEPNYVCQVTVLRERLNLKQADLARRAGLTRQAINLIERGLTVPSVTTALRLAEVLNCSVSDLFQRSKEPQLLPVIVSQSIARSQQRVRLAEVNGVWVAVPCSTNDLSEYGEADGKLVSREGIHGVVDLINSPDSLKDNLIVSGCDPALAILRDLWRRGNHQGIVHWNNLSSGAALNALRSGEAHVIGVHFHDMASQRSALALLPMDVVVIRFARWEQGWMVPQGNPQHFKGIGDLASSKIRLINRGEGAGSRLLLDALLQQAKIPTTKVKNYSKQGSTHFACARAIQEGQADIAIGLRAVAESCNLDFIPIQEVGFDLIIPKVLLDYAPVNRLLDLIQTNHFRKQLENLPGYETSETGKQLALE